MKCSKSDIQTNMVIHAIKFYESFGGWECEIKETWEQLSGLVDRLARAEKWAKRWKLIAKGYNFIHDDNKLCIKIMGEYISEKDKRIAELEKDYDRLIQSKGCTGQTMRDAPECPAVKDAYDRGANDGYDIARLICAKCFSNIPTSISVDDMTYAEAIAAQELKE